MTWNSCRTLIDATCKRMKVGESCRFSRDFFEEAYPMHPLFEDRPPIDQFLESRMSANYGAWRCTQNLIEGYYVVSRHEPGDRIIRRDFDRRHIPLPPPPTQNEDKA